MVHTRSTKTQVKESELLFLEDMSQCAADSSSNFPNPRQHPRSLRHYPTRRPDPIARGTEPQSGVDAVRSDASDVQYRTTRALKSIKRSTTWPACSAPASTTTASNPYDKTNDRDWVPKQRLDRKMGGSV
mmetsp:Transcript_34447/g.34637  ORF Transcript_34447/g.34637 Transcript_34447/m.34637 type:complete len:130 (-) Transcript_34447:252-641(-)